MTIATSSTSTPQEPQVLYRHEKRPGWGLALLAWEAADKKAYQFDDGKLRIFKEGFHDLMQPADVDGAASHRVATDLAETIASRKKSSKRDRPDPVYPFSDQLIIFRTLYPKGFQDPAWVKKHRGVEGASRKSLRDPAVADAQEQLSREALAELVEADRADEIVDRAVSVLESTSLVSIKRVRELDEAEGDVRSSLGKAIFELLHGEAGFGRRFRTWLRALRAALVRKPSWRIATSLPALFHPERHVCIRRSAFLRQAALFGPDRIYSRRPKRTAYESYLRVAESTQEALEKEGLEPRDFLDIHDFIWETLRPAAAKVLEDVEEVDDNDETLAAA